MFGALARRLFGSANDRYVKSLGPIVSAINEIEPQLEAISDEELRARTQRFKEQLANGTELDDILVEAFATVREAAKRTLGQLFFETLSACPQLVVGHRFELRLDLVDRGYDRLEALYVTIVGGAEQPPG